MNFRGVGKKGFAFSLRDMMSDHDPDVIGLQETMKKSIDVSICRNFDLENRYKWMWSPSVRRSGGIMCGIKSVRFYVLNYWSDRHYVKAKFYDKKLLKHYFLIVMYGAA